MIGLIGDFIYSVAYRKDQAGADLTSGGISPAFEFVYDLAKAIVSKDPEEIIKFITQYIDYERIFIASLENKLGDFYQALNWGGIPKNDNMADFFSF